MNYAILIAGQLDELRYVPNVANPTPETVAAFAAANGYKVLTRTDPPNPYYTESYTETDTEITNEWEPWELADAQADAAARVHADFKAAINAEVTLPCPALGEGCHVVCNLNQMLNILGDLEGADTFGDAEGHQHAVTPELVEAVRAVYAAHRNAIYAARKTAEDAISACTTVDEVWEIVTPEN